MILYVPSIVTVGWALFAKFFGGDLLGLWVGLIVISAGVTAYTLWRRYKT